MEAYDVFVSVKPKPKQPSKVRNLAIFFCNWILPQENYYKFINTPVQYLRN